MWNSLGGSGRWGGSQYQSQEMLQQDDFCTELEARRNKEFAQQTTRKITEAWKST